MREGRDEALNLRNPWAVAGIVAGAAIAGCILGSSLRRRYSFRDKTVLITGGSRGLGLEIGRILAREGAQITIVGRDPVTLESAKKELQRLGARVLSIPCDVRRQQEIQSAVEQT